jgi:prolyl oligopeptidase
VPQGNQVIDVARLIHDKLVVVSMHAKKLAATLQARGSANPALPRVETKAGHGVGKPISKNIEELADILAFLFAQVDLGG